MKSYTVKDFFKLNSPCYSCGEKVNIHANIHTMDHMPPVKLNVSVTPDRYSIPLYINYNNNNLKLIIEPKTNKYSVSNEASFIEYIKNHKIYLTVGCDECLTLMASHYLEFNILGSYIKPIGISNQHLVLLDKNNRYVINSNFIDNETNIMILAIKELPQYSSSYLKLPLLPHYRFKNKEHFIAKIKTYLLFS